jgi:hypothetical protein
MAYGHKINVSMLGRVFPELEAAASWAVGSWRDDAEEVHADIVGIRVNDSLVLYPKAVEVLRAVDDLASSDSWD